MSAHEKLIRIFTLISQLQMPLGCSKSAFAENYNISQRTFERYIKTLEVLGFQIKQLNGRYKINENNTSSYTDRITFTIEEAALVKDLLVNYRGEHSCYKSLLSKISALTDLHEVSEPIYDSQINLHISHIREAIKNKQQIILKNYISLNSNTEADRFIEPVTFTDYYNYLQAFDIDGQQMKQFKTDRIQNVKTLETAWQFESLHQKLNTDLFAMHGDELILYRLKLNNRAYRLLIEEYPQAKAEISKQENHYILETKVYSEKGIERFINGLPNQIEVLKKQILT